MEMEKRIDVTDFVGRQERTMSKSTITFKESVLDQRDYYVCMQGLKRYAATVQMHNGEMSLWVSFPLRFTKQDLLKIVKFMDKREKES